MAVFENTLFKKTLFGEISIGKTLIRNRFVRSATGEKLSTSEGLCTPPLVEAIRRLAQGGTGLIIPGHAYVAQEGRADNRQMGIHDDATLKGLTELAKAAHDGGAAVFVQLTHAGSKAERLDPDIAPPSSENMTHDDIARLVARFGDAADRAKRAGFDGVQIHLGHGYGLCQFISPFLNKRTDEYGGSLINRARIAMEIYREIRRRVGADYSVITKMNCDDFIDGGTTPEIMIEMAEMLADEGLNAVEMSGGIGHPKARFGGARNYDPQNEAEEVYYRDAARVFKKRVRIPLILVGGIRTLGTASKIVEEGLADFVSLSRPLMREPGLINRWQSGDTVRASCISCNGCAKAPLTEKGVHCVFDDALRFQ